MIQAAVQKQISLENVNYNESGEDLALAKTLPSQHFVLRYFKQECKLLREAGLNKKC